METIGYLLKRAQHALRLAMDDALEPLSLTTPQYAALSALEQTPNASSAALARACFVTPQTMIKIVQDLAKERLLERHEHPEHGRILQLALTTSGKQILKAAHKAVQQVEADMLSEIPKNKQRLLSALLQECSDNLTARLQG